MDTHARYLERAAHHNLHSNIILNRTAVTVWQNNITLTIPVVFLLLLPTPWTIFGLVGALVLIASRWIVTGVPIPATLLNPLLLILLLMSAIGLVISPAPERGAILVTQLVAGVLLFLVLADDAKFRNVPSARMRAIERSSRIERAAQGLAVVGIVLSLTVPFTVNWGPDKFFSPPLFYTGSPKIFEPTNANIMAGALAPMVPVALSLMLSGERTSRLTGAIALPPLIFTLVLLQSRGAYFGLAVGLAIWATLYRRWLLPLIPLGALVALALYALRGGPPPAQFFYGQVGTPTGGTLVERQELWAQAISLVRASPLVGIGLGAYSVIASQSPPYSPAQPGHVFPHAHNLFLQVALDAGIISAAAFIAILAIASWLAWRAYRQRSDRVLAMGVLAAFAVIVVHGFGDTVVWGSKAAIILWILLGMSVALVQSVDTKGVSK